jgi:hypothetical protein
VIVYARAFFVPRHKLALEAATLRQQLAVWKRKQPRPKLHRLDRLFWIYAPPTVAWLGRGPDHYETGNGRVLASGRIPVVLAVAVEVPATGTTQGQRRDSPLDSPHEDGQSKLGVHPGFHGELPQLGFEISAPTVSRYRQRLKRCDDGKAKRWLAVLNNHPRGDRHFLLLHGSTITSA